MNCSSCDHVASISDSWKSKWCSNEFLIGLWYNINLGPTRSHTCWFEKDLSVYLRASKVIFHYLSGSVESKEGNNFTLFWIYGPNLENDSSGCHSLRRTLAKYSVSRARQSNGKWHGDLTLAEWSERTGMLHKIKKNVSKCLKKDNI